MTYCSIQDPAVLTPSGYNTKKAVSVWSCHGKYEVIKWGLYQFVEHIIFVKYIGTYFVGIFVIGYPSVSPYYIIK